VVSIQNLRVYVPMEMERVALQFENVWSVVNVEVQMRNEEVQYILLRQLF